MKEQGGYKGGAARFAGSRNSGGSDYSDSNVLINHVQLYIRREF
jgi:hypothetical protein